VSGNPAQAPNAADDLLLLMGEDAEGAVLRYLAERPDAAVRIVASLKLAGPWSDGQRVSVGHGSDIDQLLIVAEVHEVTGGWTVTVDGEPLEDGEGAMFWVSEEAAQAAADWTLIEEGWSLAGGAVPLETL
jgi:hypothetical protein